MTRSFFAGKQAGLNNYRTRLAGVSLTALAMLGISRAATAEEASIADVPDGFPDSFNSVESLKGFESVTTNVDGSIEVILETGETVTFKASEIAFVNGQIFVAEAAITEAGLLLAGTGFSIGTPVLVAGAAALAGGVAIAASSGDSNDAPVFTSPTSFSTSENQTSAFSATVTDADGDAVSYSLSGTDAGLFSINASSGVVTFNSTPDFENPADANRDNVFQVTVTATDGSETVTQTINITVTNDNETPVITSVANATVVENQTAAFTATATDVDGDTLTYILSGADAALFAIDAATGVVTFLETPDFETPGDADGDNVYDVIVTASDGDLTATQDVAITVSDVNEVPVVTSGPSFTAAENQTAAFTATATDIDGDTLTYTLSGDDAALFAIDAATGVVTFLEMPDFETPSDADDDNVYDVTVTASDGALSATQDVAITVTDVNDAPQISTGATVSVNEGRVSIFTAAATDVDDDALTYSLSGADAASFAINAITGEVVFVGVPDFENPADVGGDNIYDVTLSVSDGDMLSEQAIQIAVLDTEDLVVEGSSLDDILDLSSQTEAAVVDSGSGNDVVITGVGDDAVSSGDGNDVIISAGGADQVDSGAGDDIINPGDGADIIQAGDGDDIIVIIGRTDENEYTDESFVNPAGTGVDVSSVATVASVNAQAEDDSNPGEVLSGGAGSDTVVVYGETNLSGTNLSSFERLILNSDVTLSGEQLTAFTNALGIQGDRTSILRIVNTDSISDVNLDNVSGLAFVEIGTGISLTLTTSELSGLQASGLEAIGGSGQLIVPDAGALDLTGLTITTDLQIIDGATNAVLDPEVLGATLTVDNIDPVIIQTEGSVEFAENGAVVAFTATAIIADNGVLTYSLSGTDASLFSIDAVTGEVTFLAVPDFESTGDANSDNSYDLIITATDEVESSDQAVSINVTDVNEAPEIDAQVTLNPEENQTAVFTATATDVDGDTLSYTLTGDDAALFAIDAATGVVTFLETPDFETPGDADADNVYDVTVTASDGDLSSTQDVAITVSDVNEAPVVTSGPSFTAAENQTAAFTATATDVDGDTLSYTLTGDDAALFAIDAATGIVTFIESPDFETPGDANGDNVYDVTITTNDGALSSAQDVAITLTDVDDTPPDAPVILSVGLVNQFVPNADGTGGVFQFLPAITGTAEAGSTVALFDGTLALGTTIAQADGSFFFAAPITSVSGELFAATATDAAGNASDIGLLNSLYGFNPSGYFAENNAPQLTIDDISVDAGFLITDSNGLLLSPDVSNAGDLNNDGFDDIIISSSSYDANGDFSGQAAVIFGGEDGFGDIVNGQAVVDISNLLPEDGFIIAGESENDFLRAVSSVGDFNGDGIDDILLGAAGSSLSSPNEGASYLIFGSDSEFGELDVTTGRQVLDLANLTADAGIVFVSGLGEFGSFGGADSNETAGDINGDGLTDLVFGDQNFSDSGSAFVVYGTTDVIGEIGDDGRQLVTVSTLTPDQGFTITTEEVGGFIGFRVNSAGDVNGDGFDDFSINAPIFDDDLAPGFEGSSFIVFGSGDPLGTENADGIAVLNLSDFSGVDGVRIIGSDREITTDAVSVSSIGDFNGDGIDDLLIGSPDLIGDRSGEAYIVFGSEDGIGTDDGNGNLILDLSTLTADTGIVLSGRSGERTGFYSTGIDDFNNDGFADVIVGSAGNNNDGAPGSAFIVYGGSNVGIINEDNQRVVDLPDLTALEGLEFRGLQDLDNVGFAISTAGDVNNDGLPDIIINTLDTVAGPASAVVIFGGITGVGESETLALVAENTTAAFVATSLGDGTVFTLGGDDAALFEIDQETGLVSFINAPDFETVLSEERFAEVLEFIDDPEDLEDFGFDLEILAVNGDVSAVQEVAITVTDVNEFAPEFTVDQNLTTSNGRYFILAEDADGTPIAIADVGIDGSLLFDDALTFEITGGVDAALFEIELRDGNSGFTGRLTFIDDPDVDAPIDANGDGIYEVEISVSDGEFLTAQTFNLSVVEGGADPVVTSPVDFIVDEFSESSIDQIVGEDPDGAGVNYSLTFSEDREFFDLNFFTGELSFIGDTVPSFETPLDADGNNVYELNVRITDGADSIVQTVTVTVNDLDFAPMLVGGTEFSISENNDITGFPGGVAFFNAVDLDLEVVSATVTGGEDAAFFDIFNEFAFPDGSGFSLTTDQVFDFEMPLDANGDNVYEIEVTFSDGVNETVELIELSILDVFESLNAPVFTTPDTVTVNESERFVINVNADDADGETPTYTISGGENPLSFFINGDTGELSFQNRVDFDESGADDNIFTVEITADDGSTNQTVQTITVNVVDIDVAPTLDVPQSISVNEGEAFFASVSAFENFDNQILTLSLDGEDASQFLFVNEFSTEGVAQANLQFVGQTDFEMPADADGDNVYVVDVVVSDGVNTVTETVTVTVLDVFESANAPVFVTSDTFTLNEGETDIVTVVATDEDGETPTYSLTGGDDRFRFEIDSQTGELSLRGPLNFNQNTNFGVDNFYSVEVTADDGSSNETTQLITVEILDIDQSPVFNIGNTIVPNTFTINENDSFSRFISVRDGDDDEVVSFELGGPDAEFFTLTSLFSTVGVAQGRFELIAPLDFETPLDSDGDGTYVIDLIASDGTNTTIETVFVIIEDVFESANAPVFVSPDTVSVDEGVGSVLFVSATDADGETPTYSITGGDDRFDFQINSTTGELTVSTFAALGPSTSGDNLYEVEVTADDGSENMTAQLITVEIIDVDVAPTITLFGSSDETTLENQAFSLAFRAQDRFDNQTLTVTLGGVDAGAFTLEENSSSPGFSSNRLNLIEIPDFEMPTDADGDNVYVVDIIVSDGVNTVTETISLTVQDVFESANAPVFTTMNSFVVNEVQNPEITNSGVTFISQLNATDEDGETPTYSITGGSDQSDFLIDFNTGELNFNGTLQFIQPGAFGDNFYTVEVTADDGSGNRTRELINIEVVDVNFTPIISFTPTSNEIEVAENDSLSRFITFSDREDGDVLTISLGGEDASNFVFVEDFSEPGHAFGNLELRSNLDFEMPTDSDGDGIYVVDVTVTDGVNVATETFSITVTDVLETGAAPVFVTSRVQSFDEQEIIQFLIEATDEDGDALTYTINGGADQFSFGLDGDDGNQLTGNFFPIFGFPEDSDGDNIYEVEIAVSDGNGNTNFQLFEIGVNDVNFVPDLFASSEIVLENDVDTFVFISGTDIQDATDTLTITLSGADADLFILENATGNEAVSPTLLFVSAPDFENPLDADGDNVYDITVELTDGVHIVTQDITITVEDEPEGANVIMPQDAAPVVNMVSAVTEEDGLLSIADDEFNDTLASFNVEDEGTINLTEEDSFDLAADAVKIFDISAEAVNLTPSSEEHAVFEEDAAAVEMQFAADLLMLQDSAMTADG